MEPRLQRPAAAAVVFVLLLSPARLPAHCDSLDGPVVEEARLALQSHDVTPVLKWLKPGAEREVREVFAQAVAVRAAGGAARQLADRLFFETVVRLHREGEGAPFSGLKPAGLDVPPGIRAADEALARGSVDALLRAVTADVENGLRARFARAAEARRHAADSVEQGRRFVAAYVAFVHYAERLQEGSRGSDALHAEHEQAGESH